MCWEDDLIKTVQRIETITLVAHTDIILQF